MCVDTLVEADWHASHLCHVRFFHELPAWPLSPAASFGVLVGLCYLAVELPANSICTAEKNDVAMLSVW